MVDRYPMYSDNGTYSLVLFHILPGEWGHTERVHNILPNASIHYVGSYTFINLNET